MDEPTTGTEDETTPPEHAPGDGHDSGEMRSVEEVRSWLLSKVRTLDQILLPLPESYGCVLAAPVTAPTDLPPFASSGMDGFAVRSSDVATATPDQPASLHIVGRAVIGQPPDATVGGGEAVRIATGSPIPAGADCVVPIEQCVLEAEQVLVLQPVEEGRHIRPTGQDVAAGELLVPAGRRLSGAELGLLASAGHASAPVHPRPRVVVLSTGDELVEPGRPTPYGTIPDANSFTVYGAVREAGATPYLGGIIRDEVDELRDSVLGLAARADCFISSGGVSVGERDVVKRAFFRRGDIDFYRVAMQPGMPQSFGEVEGCVYFGLPGNPVSTFVSFEVFIRPALLKMMGRKDLYRPEVEAVVDGPDISGPREKTQFARVRVRRHQGRWQATSTGGAGSNLLSTVTRANGLAVVPPGVDTVRAGDRVRVMLFRALEGEE